MALYHVVGEREVRTLRAKGPEMIQIVHEGKRAGARQAAERRLQAEDAAVRRRHADRSIGVRAEADRHQPCRDRRRRAARRTAGDARSVMRIASGAVVRILGSEAVGELIHRLAADQDRAGPLQATHSTASVAAGGVVREDLRTGERDHAFHIEQILHAHRHAGQRAGVLTVANAAHRRCARPRSRAGSSSVVKQLSDGIQRLDAIETARVTASALSLAATNARGDLERRSRRGIHGREHRCRLASRRTAGSSSTSSACANRCGKLRGDALAIFLGISTPKSFDELREQLILFAHLRLHWLWGENVIDCAHVRVGLDGRRRLHFRFQRHRIQRRTDDQVADRDPGRHADTDRLTVHQAEERQHAPTSANAAAFITCRSMMKTVMDAEDDADQRRAAAENAHAVIEHVVAGASARGRPSPHRCRRRPAHCRSGSCPTPRSAAPAPARSPAHGDAAISWKRLRADEHADVEQDRQRSRPPASAP